MVGKWQACFLALFLGLSLSVSAQRFEAGVFGGGAMYIGDLVPAKYIDYLKNVRPAAGILVRANFGEYLSVRAAYNFMTLTADDALKSQGNNQGLMFRSRMHELNLSAEVNLLRIYFHEASYLSPYILAGVGMFNFNPKAVYDPQYADGIDPSRPELLGEWVELQPLGTEGQGLDGYAERYRLTRPNALLGGGIKYRVSEQWMVGLEAVGRITFFDHLDDVSGVTMIYGDILNGNGVLAAEMSKPRYDPNNDGNLGREYFRGGDADDYYITFGMTVTYLFGGDGGNPFGGGKVRCPTF